jgi:hypothetical protein
MSTLIKLVLFAFLLVFLYAFARPLGVVTYCRITVGQGNNSDSVSLNQALNSEDAKVLQNQQIAKCNDELLPKLSIKPLEDLFTRLSSPTKLP